ncbi:MAG: hypothetical protein R3B13_19290 [Polyangiaceae bacterium]
MDRQVVHLGCGPVDLVSLGEFCIHRVGPDAGAYLLPPGSAGPWLTANGRFAHCTSERILPDGSPKPPCDP